VEYLTLVNHWQLDRIIILLDETLQGYFCSKVGCLCCQVHSQFAIKPLSLQRQLVWLAQSDSLLRRASIRLHLQIYIADVLNLSQL
jgi:hypothetical protein